MINILATLRFNIQAFGLFKGLRLPVFVYGKIKIREIGDIRILCPIRRRLLVIGANHNTVAAPYTVFHNTGTIEIHGRVFLNYGSVLSNSGLIVLNGDTLIGNQTNITIKHKLIIGSNASFGFETHIDDSDHHYVIDVNTHKVPRNSAAITIGNFNWFGSNCYIKKGTVTPDNLIVASPYSMLSKDYSTLPPNTVLAGCPARPVKEGIRRIYSFNNERMINEYFHEHPKAEFFQFDKDTNLDEICKL